MTKPINSNYEQERAIEPMSNKYDPAEVHSDQGVDEPSVDDIEAELTVLFSASAELSDEELERANRINGLPSYDLSLSEDIGQYIVPMRDTRAEAVINNTYKDADGLGTGPVYTENNKINKSPVKNINTLDERISKRINMLRTNQESLDARARAREQERLIAAHYASLERAMKIYIVSDDTCEVGKSLNGSTYEVRYRFYPSEEKKCAIAPDALVAAARKCADQLIRLMDRGFCASELICRINEPGCTAEVEVKREGLRAAIFDCSDS